MAEPVGEDRVVVVGAGISGLSAARALTAAGRSVVVLERAKGVGGRCATRRIEGGQPVDFGVTFLHGTDPDFLAALADVPGGALVDWPSQIRGSGRPCQPEAFSRPQRRVAFADGVAAFPRHLARGLDVRTERRVTGLEITGATITPAIDGAAPIVARTVILALAAEQSRALLAGVGARTPGLDTAAALLAMMPTRPCLTVIAAYPAGVPGPPFHLRYPEDSSILQVIAHDSSKRVNPAATVMVYQAHARWSREHLERPSAGASAAASAPWARALLDEAARLLGPWAGAPSSLQAHRWTHARADGGAGLNAPILLHFPGDPGPRLGLAGELFSPGGGVESAWMSGVRLARMILAEDKR
ncbi:MAG: FAD-dependent oxidoreductase [Byssovorax sp.]